jgi:hypothetical protein
MVNQSMSGPAGGAGAAGAACEGGRRRHVGKCRVESIEIVVQRERAAPAQARWAAARRAAAPTGSPTRAGGPSAAIASGARRFLASNSFTRPITSCGSKGLAENAVAAGRRRARLVHRLEGAGEQDDGDVRETRRLPDVLATS